MLLNAAGGNMPGATIAPDKTVLDLDVEAFRKVVDLNLFGTVLPTMVFVDVIPSSAMWLDVLDSLMHVCEGLAQ